MLPEHIKNELRHNERAIKVSYASARDAEFVRGAIRHWIARHRCRLYDSDHMTGISPQNFRDDGKTLPIYIIEVSEDEWFAEQRRRVHVVHEETD